MKSERAVAATGFLAGALLPFVLLAQSAEANHPNLSSMTIGSFPDVGWAPMSHGQGHNGEGPSNAPIYYGGADIPASWGFNPMAGEGFNACGGSTPRWARMTEAASNSTSSTLNKPELPDWPNGIKYQALNCDVASYLGRNHMTTFGDQTDAGTPGYVFHNKATVSQCSSQMMSHPCGDWSTVAAVRKSWWDAASNTNINKRKFLLHEWGHTHGFDDDCYSEASYTHDGAACSWPTTTTYQPIDRQVLFHIYGS